MEIELKKKPNNPIIIQGFPGFGLVGTISTEFLIHHLECELIGVHWFDKLPPSIAIHEGKVINPLGIYYNEKNNIVVVHSITGGPGMEWLVTDFILNLSKQVNAKEIISLEGVGTSEQKEKPDIYYYTTSEEKKEIFKKNNIKQLTEGIIMGATAGLILKVKCDITALFVETHTELPDSRAAAEMIKALDKMFNLNVDPGPLYETAKLFEQKFNRLIEKGLASSDQVKRKQLSYVG